MRTRFFYWFPVAFIDWGCSTSYLYLALEPDDDFLSVSCVLLV